MTGKIICLVGSPASGKTFLAEKLSEYFNAKIIYEIPDEGFPEKIKNNLSNQINFFENQIWFRNLQIKNHKKAEEFAKKGEIVILDTPFYQNQLYVNHYIDNEFQKEMLKYLGEIDFEHIEQPQITIYIETNKDSIREFLKKRKGTMDWENDNWRNFIINITPHVTKYMNSIESKIPNLIKIKREEFNFEKKEDFNKLINLIENLN